MALYQLQYGGHTASGETWNFSFWVDSVEALASTATAAEDWMNTFWTGGYDGLTTADVGVDVINTRQITESNGQQVALDENTVTLIGAATGNALPADVSIVTSLRTALANRSGRGRFYLPQPAASTSTTDGRLDALAQTALMSALTNAFGPMTPVWTPVVYSRTNRNTNVITTFNVGDLYDTQRRRENKLLEARSSAVMP